MDKGKLNSVNNKFNINSTLLNEIKNASLNTFVKTINKMRNTIIILIKKKIKIKF